MSHVSFAVALLAKTIISSTGGKLSETSKGVLRSFWHKFLEEDFTI